MPGPTDRDYRARLGEVLRRRDPAALHLFLRQSAASYGDERQVADVEQQSHEEMEELMHRMILARPDLADLHAESRAWLEARYPGQRFGPVRRPGQRLAGSSKGGRGRRGSGRRLPRPPVSGG